MAKLGLCTAAGGPRAAARPVPRRRVAARATDLRDFEVAGITDIPPELIPTIVSMRHLFGAELPEDITYQNADTGHMALRNMTFTCSYDEGFCGHMTVPSGKGAAARFDDVFSKRRVLPFIRDHLEIRPLYYQPPVGSADDELVIFVPGLNTLHMTKAGWWDETTTPQRLEHYVGVIQRPMSQMHLGTDMDQGEAPLVLTPASRSLLEANRGALEGGGVMPRIDGDRAYFAARQRDRMESALGQVGLARPLVQTNIIKLLKRNEVEKQPLVLMPYSRGSGETCSALKTYIEGYVEEHGEGARAEVQRLLRDYLTVFTFGNVRRDWPDGPAYVHMSGLSDRREGGTDPLVQEQGVSIRHPEGAGADAVFVHPDGLFAGFDAHNLGASGSSNLRIIMNMNQCATLRNVWEKGQKGPLRMPTYEETAAGVELCVGKRWLWNPNEAWNGVQLMPPDEARRILGKFWDVPDMY